MQNRKKQPYRGVMQAFARESPSSCLSAPVATLYKATSVPGPATPGVARQQSLQKLSKRPDTNELPVRKDRYPFEPKPPRGSLRLTLICSPPGRFRPKIGSSPHDSRTTPAVPRIFSAGYFVRPPLRCPRHRRRRSSSSRRKISRGNKVYRRATRSGRDRRLVSQRLARVSAGCP
jgi:hypothetical protein